MGTWRHFSQEKRVSPLYRVTRLRAVTFHAANDEPPLVRLPHTGFVRRIRARTSLTNAPPRLLVQTALAFRLRGLLDPPDCLSQIGKSRSLPVSLRRS